MAPPERILPLMVTPASIFTAPLTCQNTLHAFAPLIKWIFELGFAVNAYATAVGVLKIKTASGFPSAFKVRPKFSDASPGIKYIPALRVVSFPITGFKRVSVGIAALSELYALSKSIAHCPLAPSPSCITPFTFPKLVLEPLFVPTLPVRCVRYLYVPTFVTAPTEEKRTKSAAVPKGGACAKFKVGIKSRITAVNTLSSFVFIFLFFIVNKFSQNKGMSVESGKRYIISEKSYIIHTLFLKGLP